MNSNEVADIGIGEYANRFLTHDGEVFTHEQATLKLVKIAIPEKVIGVGAGHPYANLIGVSGQVYNNYNKSKDFVKVTGVTGGFKSSGYWGMQAVSHQDGGLTVFNDALTSVRMKVPAGVRFVSVRAAHYLICMDDEGGVWEYRWCSAPRVFRSMTELAALAPIKIVLPGRATAITSSRTQHSTAIVDGDPYVWCDTFGAQYIGADSAQPTPVNMKTKWELKEKIWAICSSDNTTQMITASNELLSLGDGGIGEVGDGLLHPEVIRTGTWKMEWRRFVRKPVNIGRGRKYDKLAGGNSYGFRKGACEVLNGFWSMWGYNKGGLCEMNGLRPANDVSNVADAAITKPWRITIADKQTMLSNEQLSQMKASGAYPPKEPTVLIPVNEPPIVNAGSDVVVTLPVDELLISGTANDIDGTVVKWEWSQKSGPDVVVANINKPVASLFNPVSGEYVLELKVTDNSGAWARDETKITVLPKPVTVFVSIDVMSDGSVVKR